jgi:hypothetical protein
MFLLLQGLWWTYLLFMSQKVGVCIPSGCTEDDATTNYKILYSDWIATMKTLPCSTTEVQEEAGQLGTDGWIFV